MTDQASRNSRFHRHSAKSSCDKLCHVGSGSRVLVFQKKVEIHQVMSHGTVVDSSSDDPVAKKLEESRVTHLSAMERLHGILERLDLSADFVFLTDQVDATGYDLVIALGGDGTVLHASHQIGSTPVLAINSAPQYSVGFLTATTIDEAEPILEQALGGNLSVTRLQRMAIEIDGRLVYGRVLNDVLFTHGCPARTARYILRFGDVEEEQMSSGIWIGPAAGSTAAQRAAGGKILRPGSKKLQFIVREPYTRSGEAYQLIKGLVPPGESLFVRNFMDSALLYVDGPHVEIPVHLGEVVELHLSEEPLQLLGFRRRNRP